jgi:hypothetical protein
MFEVTDQSAGLDAIRAELDSLHALQYAEIGYLDNDTGLWQWWYPRHATEPFTKILAMLDDWFKKTRRIPPQAPGLTPSLTP